jgi:hypothetical protein
MKLSKSTLVVLKNFASINDGIVFRSGNILRTCDAQKQVLAEATIDETIPSEFGIHDLNKFLSVLSLYGDNADIELAENNKSAYLITSRRKTHYRLCDASMVKNAPEKSISMPSVDVSFTLSQEDLESTLKSSSVLGTPHIAINSDGSKVYVSVLDSKDNATHTSQLELCDGTGKKYNMLFKTENLKMIPGEYEVSISFKGIANFKNKTSPIQYWVATELGSSGEA